MSFRRPRTFFVLFPYWSTFIDSAVNFLFPYRDWSFHFINSKLHGLQTVLSMRRTDGNYNARFLHRNDTETMINCDVLRCGPFRSNRFADLRQCFKCHCIVCFVLKFQHLQREKNKDNFLILVDKSIAIQPSYLRNCHELCRQKMKSHHNFRRLPNLRLLSDPVYHLSIWDDSFYCLATADRWNHGQFVALFES